MSDSASASAEWSSSQSESQNASQFESLTVDSIEMKDGTLHDPNTIQIWKPDSSFHLNLFTKHLSTKKPPIDKKAAIAIAHRLSLVQDVASWFREGMAKRLKEVTTVSKQTCRNYGYEKKLIKPVSQMYTDLQNACKRLAQLGLQILGVMSACVASLRKEPGWKEDQEILSSLAIPVYEVEDLQEDIDLWNKSVWCTMAVISGAERLSAASKTTILQRVLEKGVKLFENLACLYEDQRTKLHDSSIEPELKMKSTEYQEQQQNNEIDFLKISEDVQDLRENLIPMLTSGLTEATAEQDILKLQTRQRESVIADLEKSSSVETVDRQPEETRPKIESLNEELEECKKWTNVLDQELVKLERFTQELEGLRSPQPPSPPPPTEALEEEEKEEEEEEDLGEEDLGEEDLGEEDLGEEEEEEEDLGEEDLGEEDLGEEDLEEADRPVAIPVPVTSKPDVKDTTDFQPPEEFLVSSCSSSYFPRVLAGRELFKRLRESVNIKGISLTVRARGKVQGVPRSQPVKPTTRKELLTSRQRRMVKASPSPSTSTRTWQATDTEETDIREHQPLRTKQRIKVGSRPSPRRPQSSLKTIAVPTVSYIAEVSSSSTIATPPALSDLEVLDLSTSLHQTEEPPTRLSQREGSFPVPPQGKTPLALQTRIRKPRYPPGQSLPPKHFPMKLASPYLMEGWHLEDMPSGSVVEMKPQDRPRTADTIESTLNVSRLMDPKTTAPEGKQQTNLRVGRRPTPRPSAWGRGVEGQGHDGHDDDDADGRTQGTHSRHVTFVLSQTSKDGVPGGQRLEQADARGSPGVAVTQQALKGIAERTGRIQQGNRDEKLGVVIGKRTILQSEGKRTMSSEERKTLPTSADKKCRHGLEPHEAHHFPHDLHPHSVLKPPRLSLTLGGDSHPMKHPLATFMRGKKAGVLRDAGTRPDRFQRGVQKGASGFEDLRNVTVRELEALRLCEHAQTVRDIDCELEEAVELENAITSFAENVEPALMEFEETVIRALYDLEERDRGKDSLDKGRLTDDAMAQVPSGLEDWSGCHSNLEEEEKQYLIVMENYRKLWNIYNTTRAKMLSQQESTAHKTVKEEEERSKKQDIADIPTISDAMPRIVALPVAHPPEHTTLPKDWKAELSVVKDAFDDGAISSQEYTGQLMLLLKVASVLQHKIQMLGNNYIDVYLKKALSQKTEKILEAVENEKLRLKGWQQVQDLADFNKTLDNLDDLERAVRLRHEEIVLAISIIQRHQQIKSILRQKITRMSTIEEDTEETMSSSMAGIQSGDSGEWKGERRIVREISEETRRTSLPAKREKHIIRVPFSTSQESRESWPQERSSDGRHGEEKMDEKASPHSPSLPAHQVGGSPSPRMISTAERSPAEQPVCSPQGAVPAPSFAATSRRSAEHEQFPLSPHTGYATHIDQPGVVPVPPSAQDTRQDAEHDVVPATSFAQDTRQDAEHDVVHAPSFAQDTRQDAEHDVVPATSFAQDTRQDAEHDVVPATSFAQDTRQDAEHDVAPARPFAQDTRQDAEHDMVPVPPSAQYTRQAADRDVLPAFATQFDQLTQFTETQCLEGKALAPTETALATPSQPAATLEAGMGPSVSEFAREEEVDEDELFYVHRRDARAMSSVPSGFPTDISVQAVRSGHERPPARSGLPVPLEVKPEVTQQSPTQSFQDEPLSAGSEVEKGLKALEPQEAVPKTQDKGERSLRPLEVADVKKWSSTQPPGRRLESRQWLSRKEPSALTPWALQSRGAVENVLSWVRRQVVHPPANIRPPLPMGGSLGQQKNVQTRLVRQILHGRPRPKHGVMTPPSAPSRPVNSLLQDMTVPLTQADTHRDAGWSKKALQDGGNMQDCRLLFLDVSQSWRKAGRTLKLMKNDQRSQLPTAPGCQHIWNKFLNASPSPWS